MVKVSEEHWDGWRRLSTGDVQVEIKVVKKEISWSDMLNLATKCALCNKNIKDQIDWKIYKKYYDEQKAEGIVNFLTDASLQTMSFPDGSSKQLLGGAVVAGKEPWIVKVRMNT